MSDLSEQKKKSPPTESIDAAATLGAQVQPPSRRVGLWAAFGAAVLALQVYVWIRWVTGPYFTSVDPGPTPVPGYMKTILTMWTAGIVLIFPIGIWWFIVRPWVRERRITLDGMLIASMGLMFFQDPLLNFFNTWCTYNTWMWNRGAWTPYIPGWSSPDEPGAQVVEPLLMNAPGYAVGVLLCTIAGCWFMRKVKGRWPGISNLQLIGVTFVYAFFFDLVMEGFVLMPIGLYTFPGSIQSLSINAGTYYQWPVYEGLMWGGAQTAFCCLRYFTDDRGRTVVERGLDNIRGGVVKQQFIRFLAIFGACSAIFLCFYNIPVQFFAAHSDPWPEDVQKRSYFTSKICGEDSVGPDGKPMPCPDPSLPMPSVESGYVNFDREFVPREGSQLPTMVPLDR
ncbi:spirocyclase AveC family protein [Aldersonia kunmingensis]|uniref:spirocyclase AveC family protein n=1 Tax=Aldersonia kunmingensis TaxID=408066 RepID=UPI00082D32EC|nr:spirocyclase AveC family protein [Aldersonia kunmingensis]